MISKQQIDDAQKVLNAVTRLNQGRRVKLIQAVEMLEAGTTQEQRDALREELFPSRAKGPVQDDNAGK